VEPGVSFHFCSGGGWRKYVVSSPGEKDCLMEHLLSGKSSAGQRILTLEKLCLLSTFMFHIVLPCLSRISAPFGLHIPPSFEQSILCVCTSCVTALGFPPRFSSRAFFSVPVYDATTCWRFVATRRSSWSSLVQETSKAACWKEALLVPC
jgi:hypothetical protein